jgi:hypothetical protein
VTTVAEYQRDVKARLIADPLVLQFDIRRERQTRSDGHMRVRMTLSNGDLLEFSEYVQQIGERVEVVTYSYHWTDAEGTLIRRWDNASHYPHLPRAPHHIHDGRQDNVRPGMPIRLTQVLDEIATYLAQ